MILTNTGNLWYVAVGWRMNGSFKLLSDLGNGEKGKWLRQRWIIPASLKLRYFDDSPLTDIRVINVQNSPSSHFFFFFETRYFCVAIAVLEFPPKSEWSQTQDILLPLTPGLKVCATIPGSHQYFLKENHKLGANTYNRIPNTTSYVLWHNTTSNRVQTVVNGISFSGGRLSIWADTGRQLRWEQQPKEVDRVTIAHTQIGDHPHKTSVKGLDSLSKPPSPTGQFARDRCTKEADLLNPLIKTK